MARPAPKDRPSHRCAECGLTVAKWVGQCPECQAWGSITEVGASRVQVSAGAVTTAARPIDAIDVEAAQSRSTGVDELDRVLGGGLVAGAVILLAGDPGAGKALALDTALPTPDGWTTMGEVAVGDLLLGSDGHPTRVLAATAVLAARPCFRVRFSDGSTITADAQHEWWTTTRSDRVRGRSPKVRTTMEISSSCRVGTDQRANHAVLVVAPLALETAALPIPPYTLGAWLGDGSSDGGALTTGDPEIVMCIEAEGIRVTRGAGKLRYGLAFPAPAERLLHPRRCQTCGTWFIPKFTHARVCGVSCSIALRGVPNEAPIPRCESCEVPITGHDGYTGVCDRCRKAQTFTGTLRRLGVLNNKHIPQAYLRASEEQRRALLAGLLDTDGSVSRSGCVDLSLTSARLADDAHELVLSLGYKAARTSKPVPGRSAKSSTSYRISFSPPEKVFRLQRKIARLCGGHRTTQRLRYIVDVQPVHSVPVRCVQVDSADHTYLAGLSMIPTHNSTLCLELAARAAREGAPSLYVTGEESAAQVRLRAERTDGLDSHLWLAAETDLAALLGHIDAVRPALLVVDSVQTIGTTAVEGSAGGVTQIRAVTAALVAVAKERGIATVLVGHVTKDGSIAGPRLLEHLVDVVLHFEGDRHSTLRMVRAVKNRYGPADEVGCFALTGEGIVGLADPSGLFLSRRPQPVAGTCVTVTVEGRRPLLAEVQALVAASTLPSPRRAVSGLDPGRVAMVLAVTERRGGIRLASNDVYTATVGGMRLTEPATDLALALALASAVEDRPLPTDLIALGELGLSGELRPVPDLQRRLAEAARLGFRRAVVPLGSESAGGMSLSPVSDLGQALVALENMRRPPAPRQVGLTLA